MLHNTITLTLTAVRTVKLDTFTQECGQTVAVQKFLLVSTRKPLTIVMAHLVGIDKGPVMDWTNDTGLDEHYRKWKK